jgi:hypothetical protein
MLWPRAGLVMTRRNACAAQDENLACTRRFHKGWVRCGKVARELYVAQHDVRYSGRMADPTDYDSLAKRYLDLWQSQLSALSSDRQLTDTMARLLATTNASVATAFETARRAHADARQRDAGAGGAAPGTAAAAAALADGAAELGQLRARLDALEQRVAALESKPRRRAAKPRTKPDPAAPAA